jgi:hypothetical protein
MMVVCTKTICKNVLFLLCCLGSFSANSAAFFTDQAFKANREKLGLLLAQYKEQDPEIERQAVANEIIKWADERKKEGRRISIDFYAVGGSRSGGDALWCIDNKDIFASSCGFWDSSLAKMLLAERQKRLLLSQSQVDPRELMTVDQIKSEWLTWYFQPGRKKDSLKDEPRRTFDWFVTQEKDQEAVAEAEENS